jgi:2-methylisocitrate lyase-like PEP mutase family enzyme
VILDAAPGTTCIYPIGVSHERDISTLVAELPGPVNGNTRPGGPDLARLRELGVARVSYGPRLYREALASLKTAVQGVAHSGRHVSVITATPRSAARCRQCRRAGKTYHGLSADLFDGQAIATGRWVALDGAVRAI